MRRSTFPHNSGHRTDRFSQNRRISCKCWCREGERTHAISDRAARYRFGERLLRSVLPCFWFGFRCHSIPLAYVQRALLAPVRQPPRLPQQRPPFVPVAEQRLLVKLKHVRFAGLLGTECYRLSWSMTKMLIMAARKRALRPPDWVIHNFLGSRESSISCAAISQGRGLHAAATRWTRLFCSFCDSAPMVKASSTPVPKAYRIASAGRSRRSPWPRIFMPTMPFR